MGFLEPDLSVWTHADFLWNRAGICPELEISGRLCDYRKPGHIFYETAANPFWPGFP